MTEGLLEWGRAHGPAGVFALITVENLGIPWPTPVAMLVAADLIQQGQLTFPGAVLLCTCAHLAGGAVSYAIASAGDNALTARLAAGSGPARALQWLDRWYAGYGHATVFGARLVGQVRPWASYAAGLGEVRPLPFIIWTALGSAAHATIVLKLLDTGFTIWQTHLDLPITIVVLAAVALWAACAFGLWRYHRACELSRRK